jgi:hypothetical protein
MNEKQQKEDQSGKNKGEHILHMNNMCSPFIKGSFN